MLLAALMVATLQTPSSPAARPLRPRARPDPAALVKRALDGIGGAEAVRNLPSLTVDYYSATYGLGQEETPGSPARPTATIGHGVTDWLGVRRALTTETRQVTGAVQRQRRVTVQGKGMVEAGNGAQQPETRAAVATVERIMRLAPERILLAAVDEPGTLTSLAPHEWRGEEHDGAHYVSGPDTLDLYFDRASGLLDVVEQVTDDPILGDRHTVTTYTRWQPAGALRLPRQIDVAVNGRLQTNTIVTAATVGRAPDSLFQIPDSIAARAERSTPDAVPAPLPLALDSLAPGVWRATGGTHFSLVVEQATQLVVVEAPLNAARTTSLLDTLRARFPTKRVAMIVNTHHHWDHAGGLRAAMAAGIPILTHRRNVRFVRNIANAPKTVAPDALSRRPHAPSLHVVDDSVTIGAGESRVVIYRLPTTHVEGMLAAYIPAARLLFTSDVLTPGPTLSPVGAGEIAALARTRAITVERVAGGHGGIASWPDVERAAGN